MKLLPPGILKDYFYNLKKDITSSAFGRWFIENESKPEFDQELQEIWKESSQVACDREMTSSAFVKVCEANWWSSSVSSKEYIHENNTLSDTCCSYSVYSFIGSYSLSISG